MTITATVPEYVPAARRRKALALHAALTGGGGQVTAEQVVHLSERGRRIAEHLAGVRRGSTLTWTLVADLAAGSATALAVCPGCGHGDPDGVPGPPKPHGHTGPCAR